jgi:DNA repair exonuclease SbcCD nuclease subunit
MSVLLIGDPHFKTNNKEETDLFCQETYKYLENNDSPDKIIVLGDVLDTHEKINIRPMIRATTFLLKLTKYCKDIFVLVGNHDRPDNSVFLGPEHSLFTLKFTGINIVDNVEIFDDLVFVPYVEPGRFLEALATKNISEKDLQSGKYKAIFAHQEFKGAQMGGIVSLMGDEWKKEWTPVYSGHIHDFQIMDNVTYVGTPYQTGYSDNSDKGLYLLDTEKNSLEKIKLNIIPKMIRHVKIEEILELKFDENIKTKLVIEGDAREIRRMIVEKEYKRKLKGIPYIIKDIPKYVFPEEKEKVIYTIPKIVEMIKKECDPDEKKILENIFGQ